MCEDVSVYLCGSGVCSKNHAILEREGEHRSVEWAHCTAKCLP